MGKPAQFGGLEPPSSGRALIAERIGDVWPMVIHKAERGNDLTARIVNVYTLEELRSLRIEQIVADIRDFAQIVQAFPPDPDHIEDSCAQIADDVLWKIEDLLKAVRRGRDGSVNSDFVAILALKVGVLAERLEWMWRHSEAARKGYFRKNHEQLVQRMGAEGNKRKRRKKINDIAELLKKALPAEQLSILTDSALARHLAKSGLGGIRAIRGYVAEARKLQLIPARSEM